MSKMNEKDAFLDQLLLASMSNPTAIAWPLTGQQLCPATDSSAFLISARPEFLALPWTEPGRHESSSRTALPGNFLCFWHCRSDIHFLFSTSWHCFPSSIADFNPRSSHFRICSSSLTLCRPRWKDDHTLVDPFAGSSPRIMFLIPKQDGETTPARKHEHNGKVLAVRKHTTRHPCGFQIMKRMIDPLNKDGQSMDICACCRRQSQ